MMLFERAVPIWLGRYKLISRIGSGGMSEVYHAKLFGPGGYEKNLAIKILLPHFSREREFLNMLMDEAKITSILDHPNIVHVFEFGEWNGIHYIAMEYVRGKDLRNILKIKEKLSEEITIFITVEILNALEYAHSLRGADGEPLQIVHRDISPQNILVSFDGNVKLADFGIAKARGKISTTRTGFLKGKFLYMSPEQIAGRTLDGRSDLFSLAVVAIEMLTGKRVFDGDTEGAIINSIRNVEPSEIGKDLPDKKWIKILLQCLQKEPDMRPPSASVLKKEILALTGDLYIRGKTSLKELMDTLEENEPVFLAEERGEPSPEDHAITKTLMKPDRKKRLILFSTAGITGALLLFLLFRGTKFIKPEPGSSILSEVSQGKVEDALTSKEVMGERTEKMETSPQNKLELPPREEGYLSIHTVPWTLVTLNGEEMNTPVLKKKIPAGRYKLRIHNEKFGIEETVEVEVEPGKETKLFKKYRNLIKNSP